MLKRLFANVDPEFLGKLSTGFIIGGAVCKAGESLLTKAQTEIKMERLMIKTVEDRLGPTLEEILKARGL